MNDTCPVRSATVPSVSAPTSSVPSKVKRPRRSSHRRPKAIPATTRQKLALLGYTLRTHDTTDANLSELIAAMSRDLHAYTTQAQHWQQKLLSLKASSSNANETESDDSAMATQHYESQLDQDSPISAFEHELLQRLRRTKEPTLSMVTMPKTRIQSSVRYMTDTNAAFLVLDNAAKMAQVFGVLRGSGGKHDALTRVKSDFSEKRYLQVWNMVFAPIDAPPHALAWDCSPDSRQLSALSIDPNDQDYDAMDRCLAHASDADVIDMLQYVTLMLIGLGQLIVDDPKWIDVRDHIGMSGERLLREAIFSRNIGTQSEFASNLITGMIGLIRYFSAHARVGAVVSLLEIAWQTAVQHVEYTHPVMRGLISFVSTVLASTQSRRSVWLARNQKTFQSTKERYFHLTSTAHFAAAYFALTTRDEDSLYYYLAQLDELLAPTPAGSVRLTSNERVLYRDSFCCFNAPCSCPHNPAAISSPTDSNHPSQLSYVSSPGVDSESSPFVHLPGCPLYVETWGNAGINHDISSETSSVTSSDPSKGIINWESLLSTETLGSLIASPSTAANVTHNEGPVPFSNACLNPPISSESIPPPQPIEQELYNVPVWHGTRNQAPATTGPPFFPEPADASSNIFTPISPTTTSYDGPVPTLAVNRSKEPVWSKLDTMYVPSEDFKATLRSAVNLIRAEAAVLDGDYSTCRHWMDQSEREIRSVPDLFLSHKLFLLDLPSLKHVFRSTCPFSSGTHTIAEEFEYRVRAELERRRAGVSSHPAPNRPTIL